MKTTRIYALLLIITLIFAFSSCSKPNNSTDLSSGDYPVVTITFEGYGDVVVELYPHIAPNTVNNFIYLVESGFYNNNTCHRVYTDFMLQGGDPTGTGTGGPDYSIKGEFTSNGFKNDLKHEKGVISMARATSPNSAGSQFFIMLEAAPHLDGDYAAFGKVISGMEVAEAIEEAVGGDASNNGMLASKDIITITKATVDTKGVDYPEPEKIK